MKEDKKKKKNQVWETIKKLWQTPRGRGILFFAIYFIFFALLIMGMRSSATMKQNNSNNTTENKTNFTYHLDGIENANYYFTVTENRDSSVISYNGSRNGDRMEILSSTNQEYFLYGDLALEKVNETFVASINPFLYPTLLHYDTIEKILSDAHLTATTEYEEGGTLYQYNITTTTLAQILDDEVIDLDDLPNTINVTANEENQVIKIEYILNSYDTYKLGMISNLTITMEYRDFGTVGELVIPS